MSISQVKNRLNDLKLQIIPDSDTGDTDQEASPFAIQRALQFATETRLAPFWNRVGRNFVRFGDFLERTRLITVEPELRFTQTMESSMVTLTLKAAFMYTAGPLKLDMIKADQRL